MNAPQTNSILTLIQFSDLHVWRIGLDGDIYCKRLLGLANLLLRRGRAFPESVARALVDRILADQADCVCFSGDLTTSSSRAEFEAARRLLNPIMERWGDRFVAIPGNHDRYTPRAVRKRLYETLFDDRFETYPVCVDLNEIWTLVGIDCSIPRPVTARGHLDETTLERLGGLLKEVRARGRRMIVMGHYPLLYPPTFEPGWGHVLPQRRPLLDLLLKTQVSLYLHGHKHNRWRLKYKDLTLLNAGSAGMVGNRPDRRPGYLKLTLTDTGLVKAEGVSLQVEPGAAWDTDLAAGSGPSAARWTIDELKERQGGLK